MKNIKTFIQIASKFITTHTSQMSTVSAFQAVKLSAPTKGGARSRAVSPQPPKTTDRGSVLSRRSGNALKKKTQEFSSSTTEKLTEKSVLSRTERNDRVPRPFRGAVTPFGFHFRLDGGRASPFGAFFVCSGPWQASSVAGQRTHSLTKCSPFPPPNQQSNAGSPRGAVRGWRSREHGPPRRRPRRRRRSSRRCHGRARGQGGGVQHGHSVHAR